MANWRRRIIGLGPIIARIDELGVTFEEIRAEAVALLKADEAYGGDNYEHIDRRRSDSDERTQFTEAVWELAEATDEREFDWALNELYDWADRYRVWIDPIEERQRG